MITGENLGFRTQHTHKTNELMASLNEMDRTRATGRVKRPPKWNPLVGYLIHPHAIGMRPSLLPFTRQGIRIRPLELALSILSSSGAI